MIHNFCTERRWVVSYTVTNSMEQSPSWKANMSSASTEISHILWIPNVHCRIHNSPPPASIQDQIDLFHVPTSHFSKIHFNIILPLMPGYSNWPLSLRFLAALSPRETPSFHVKHEPERASDLVCKLSGGQEPGFEVMSTRIQRIRV
jgi:hypothetical protein